MKMNYISSYSGEKKAKKPLNKRKLKYGSLATGLTVLFVAAVVLANVVVTILFERFPINIDLTRESIYSVSKETESYITSLEVPIDITVMVSEEQYRAVSEYAVQCAELLEKYSQYNPLITVRYKDLLSNPDFVANYSQSLEQGDIIVEPANGDHTRVKVVKLIDIINVAEDYESYLTSFAQQYGAAATHNMFYVNKLIVSSNAEQALTSAIMAVSDANPITVAVLSYTGANESEVSGLTNLLDKNGYILTNINIQTEEIGNDVDMVVISAPKVDYTEQETEKIQKWLTNNGVLGKDMIYIASPEQPETPNIDALLYRYGIVVEQKIIYETNSNYYYGTQSTTFQSITDDEFTAGIVNPYLSLIVPNSRAVTTRFEDADAYNSCKILASSSSSAVLKDMGNSDENWSTDSATEKGAFTSVALARYTALNQETHIRTYNDILVVGSDTMIYPTIIGQSQFANGDFFINVINEMTGKTEGVTIVPKKVQSKSVLVSDSVKNTLNLVFAVVIPVVVLALGTFVYFRRRHK